MVDHPLIADELRRYIQRHKIEESLNIALNEVLEKLPQDPFSELAASLIDVSKLFFFTLIHFNRILDRAKAANV